MCSIDNAQRKRHDRAEATASKDKEVLLELRVGFKFSGSDEEDSIFEVFYEMNLMWYDPQLKYDFLKTQISGNIIRNTNSIWTPNLVFYHIKNEEIIEKTLHVVKNENEILQTNLHKMKSLHNAKVLEKKGK